MKITVVTICWNSARTLARSVRSVLRQTYLPAEYLFVDGGSTDGTLELLAELSIEAVAAGVSWQVLPQERRLGEAGIPSAWNQGLAAAQGEVIALLNSDDWYEPDALEQALTAFTRQESPKPGLVVAPVTLVDGATGKPTKVLYPKCLWLTEFLMPVPHPGCFVRREVYFSQVGLFDCRYKISADYDFIWRCRLSGVELFYLSDPLVNMEIGGLANQSRRQARWETLSIAREHSRLPLLAWLAWGVRGLAGR